LLQLADLVRRGAQLRPDLVVEVRGQDAEGGAVHHVDATAPRLEPGLATDGARRQVEGELLRAPVVDEVLDVEAEVVLTHESSPVAASRRLSSRYAPRYSAGVSRFGAGLMIPLLKFGAVSSSS